MNKWLVRYGEAGIQKILHTKYIELNEDKMKIYIALYKWYIDDICKA